MPVPPFFSIIVPTKDRKDLLIRAIKSVIDQTYQDWELIIVDDHSTDGTKEEVHKIIDQRIKFISNKGVERSAARNTGIDVANGKYICFLDDDDEYKEHFLRDFYNELERINFPNDIILRTGFIYKYADGKEKKAKNYEPIKHKNPLNFAAYHMCGVWSMCIPREAMNGYRFDERFPHWQDNLLILKILLRFDLIDLHSLNYYYNKRNEPNIEQENLIEKCEINVAAIKSYFEKTTGWNNYLSKSTPQFLYAEKYIQYAIRLLLQKGKTPEAHNIFCMSLREGFFFRNWKYYVIYLFTYVKALI